jgi:hypothetical protein
MILQHCSTRSELTQCQLIGVPERPINRVMQLEDYVGANDDAFSAQHISRRLRYVDQQIGFMEAIRSERKPPLRGHTTVRLIRDLIDQVNSQNARWHCANVRQMQAKCICKSLLIGRSAKEEKPSVFWTRSDFDNRYQSKAQCLSGGLSTRFSGVGSDSRRPDFASQRIQGEKRGDERQESERSNTPIRPSIGRKTIAPSMIRFLLGPLFIALGFSRIYFAEFTAYRRQFFGSGLVFIGGLILLGPWVL